MAWLKLLGGLGTLFVAAMVVASLAGVARAIASDAAALAVFALVVVVAAAVVGLGITGRRNPGAGGEPYW